MKKFTFFKGFVSLFLVAITATQLSAQTATITAPAAGTTTIAAGGTVTFTATRSGNFPGSGNYFFDWVASPSAGVTFNPASENGNGLSSSTTVATFTQTGTYSITCSVHQSGTPVVTAAKTVVVNAAVPANLWATSSSGLQISAFSVSNGTYNSGPTNLFAATFPGTTTGGTSTAALGRNAQGGNANGFFYWLPNTTNNSGTVEVFAGNSNGTSVARVGSVDVNGGNNNNSLGFVRLGMGPDGTGWILAGDGSTLYLAKFSSNGVQPVTITTVPVSLATGAVATFQNGDICVSGNNTVFALANDGNGVTQIYTGSLSNPSVTLSKRLDLVDPTNAAFSGTVNGVAFDALGSLYITTGAGLYYIDQATVNGPAGTVQCSLVVSQTGLQDLASNVFPANTTLPVKLSAFGVTKQGGNAVLNWSTSSEINSDHFEIERSIDGINFSRTGIVAASGTSNTDKDYRYTDLIPAGVKAVYYRLKTVDIDARASYSKIVVLYTGTAVVKSFTVYPNPFTDNVKIRISAEKENTATLRVVNASGQVEISRGVMLQPGDNIVVLTSELSKLNPGLHFLEIITTDGSFREKLIKK